MVFSGEKKQLRGDTNYTAGVATIMGNDMVKHIEDIEPIGDRLMTMTLNGILKTTIITVHIPQA